ncbi:MAG: endolytic transglycosylase MltG [Asticcacaulis sp.]
MTSISRRKGAILPDTYQYQRGEARQAVLDRMLEAGRKTIDELWAKRAPGLPLATKEDAIILASIVERETALPSERPRRGGGVHQPPAPGHPAGLRPDRDLRHFAWRAAGARPDQGRA